MFRNVILLITAGLLAGCAGRGAVVDHSEIYMRHAGDPVPRIRYHQVRSWRPVSGDMIAMDFGGRGGYLFELSPECHSRFRSGLTIRLDTYMDGIIDIGDRIIVEDVHRCRILSMRPVDIRAAREELAAGVDEADSGAVESAKREGDQESGGT
jgi:hypothetical protein